MPDYRMQRHAAIRSMVVYEVQDLHTVVSVKHARTLESKWGGAALLWVQCGEPLRRVASESCRFEKLNKSVSILRG